MKSYSVPGMVLRSLRGPAYIFLAPNLWIAMQTTSILQMRTVTHRDTEMLSNLPVVAQLDVGEQDAKLFFITLLRFSKPWGGIYSSLCAFIGRVGW